MIPPKEIIYEKGEKTINISHSLGYFVFTPPKTGSTTAARVFDNFDFQNFQISDVNNIQLIRDKFKHTHYYNSIPNYESYKLICTIRNPYSKYVSLFKYDGKYDYSLYKIPNKWEDFYDQSTADFVYSKNQSYFDYFGYDKNSWKKN